MKVGCNTVAFRTQPLDFALERIAAAGYEWVEVEANLSWCPHADPWEDDADEFRRRVADHGFRGVSALGSHRELITQEQGAADVAQALVWCREAGVPIVLTGEGRLGEGMAVTDALAILRDRLGHLAEVARDSGVVLALEDHGSISLASIDGLPRILDLVESEWVGVNFDTANIHRGDYVGTDRDGYEWKLGAAATFDEVAALRLVAPRVRHLHVKDIVGRDAVTLGEGEIDLLGCLDVLRETGFDGVLSYETEGMQAPDESTDMIRRSRKFLVEALDKGATFENQGSLARSDTDCKEESAWAGSRTSRRSPSRPSGGRRRS